jgi:hypothetical protein
MNDRHNRQFNTAAAAVAEIVTIVAGDVLAQRLDQAAEWQRLAQQRKEAKALVAAVDAWLQGGAA